VKKKSPKKETVRKIKKEPKEGAPKRKRRKKQIFDPSRAPTVKKKKIVDESFACEFCPKAFISKAKLNDHTYDSHIEDIMNSTTEYRYTPTPGILNNLYLLEFIDFGLICKFAVFLQAFF
jgi:hypothetical protein